MCIVPKNSTTRNDAGGEIMQEQLVLDGDPGKLAQREVKSPLDLLSLALSRDAAIDVIERLSALQERAMDRDAEMQFNEAMNAVQMELGRVAPDLTNPQTHSRYASYAALDKKIRPIYTKHGFSLSFDSGDSPLPDTVRVLCFVSHKGGHTRKYTGPPMPADGKGAKGGEVMSKTHATGAAMSYGARYLLKYIFNISVGEEDTDGNEDSNGELAEQVEFLQNASTPEELKKLYAAAYEQFEATPAALKVLIAARKARKEEMGW
jgi:hypothetical protein